MYKSPFLASKALAEISILTRCRAGAVFGVVFGLAQGLRQLVTRTLLADLFGRRHHGAIQGSGMVRGTTAAGIWVVFSPRVPAKIVRTGGRGAVDGHLPAWVLGAARAVGGVRCAADALRGVFGAAGGCYPLLLPQALAPKAQVKATRAEILNTSCKRVDQVRDLATDIFS